MIVDVVVGLQHGDEGKGKVVYNLLKQSTYNICLRFNGGPNAGHSIKYISLDLVLHQIPCGVLFKKTSIIGSNCVVDINKLQYELLYLENIGYKDVRKHLFIAYNAHIIQDTHIYSDLSKNLVGTTLSGIGNCYSDKALRTGMRAIDCKEILENMNIKLVEPVWLFKNMQETAKQCKILCEGAQGYMLDIDHGEYPFCTSSSCLSGSICSSGIPSNLIRNVYGCAKIYDTYIGYKFFEPENDIQLQLIGETGNEYGSTTGRKRQCNWMNIENVKKAVFMNGCTHIIVNKCDIFKQINYYRIDDNIFETFEELQQYFESEMKTVNKNIQITFSENPYII